MMQLYVLRYGVEAIGNLAGIGLKNTNNMVPVLVGMILSCFYREEILARLGARTDAGAQN